MTDLCPEEPQVLGAALKHALGQRRVQLATVGLHVHRQPGPVGGQVRRRRQIQVLGAGGGQQRDRVVDAEVPEGGAAEAAVGLAAGPGLVSHPYHVDLTQLLFQAMPHGQRGAPDRRGVGGTGGGGRRDRQRRGADPLLRVAAFVGEVRPNLDFLAIVGRGQRVVAARGAWDVHFRAAPPVAVAGSGQAVGVIDVARRRLQRHPHLRRPRDLRIAGGRGIARRIGRPGPRRRPAAVALDVGGAHLHPVCRAGIQARNDHGPSGGVRGLVLGPVGPGRLRGLLVAQVVGVDVGTGVRRRQPVHA